MAVQARVLLTQCFTQSLQRRQQQQQQQQHNALQLTKEVQTKGNCFTSRLLLPRKLCAAFVGGLACMIRDKDGVVTCLEKARIFWIPARLCSAYACVQALKDYTKDRQNRTHPVVSGMAYTKRQGGDAFGKRHFILCSKAVFAVRSVRSSPPPLYCRM